MKKIRQIREDHNSILNNTQVDSPEGYYVDLALLEETEKDAEKASFDKKIPFMIMMKRKSIRQFPNNQTVALYYAQNIDRYISIPFGRKAEAVIAEETDQEREARERAESLIKSGAATGPFKTMLMKKHGITGDKKVKAAKPAVQPTETENKPKKKEKPPEFGLGKTVKALHGAGMDPMFAPAAAVGYGLGAAVKGAVSLGKKSIGIKEETLREKFNRKINEKKVVNEASAADVADTAADIVVPYYSAGKKAIKGDYAGAAKEAAIDTALMAIGGPVAKGIGKAGMAAYRGVSKFLGKSGAKAAERDVLNVASSTAKGTGRGLAKKAGGAALGFGLGSALGSRAGRAGGGSGTGQSRPSYQFSLKPKASSSQRVTMDPTAVQQQKKALGINESIIDQLRELATKTDLTKDILMVNEEQIDINNNIAEKVVKVYDSLNKKNKAKFAKMLGESKASFKKAVNFALRY